MYNKPKLIYDPPDKGNDPNNPNGMKLYAYKGVRIAAYNSKDVPNKYRYLYPNKNKVNR